LRGLSGSLREIILHCGRTLALQAGTGNQRQAKARNRAELTAESERTIAALLLAHAPDVMIQSIEHRDLAIALHREAARLREDSVAGAILRAAARWHPKIAGPPIVAACATLGRWLENLVVGQCVLKLAAEIVDGGFEIVIKHIAHHRHPAAHPLPATELRATELGHAAPAIVHGHQHPHRGIIAEAVALGNVIDDVLSGWKECLHG